MLLFLSSLYDNWINLGGFGLNVFGLKPFDIIFLIISIFFLYKKKYKLVLDKNDKLFLIFLVFYFILSLVFNPTQILRNVYMLIVFPFSFLFGKSLNKNYIYKIISFTLALWVMSFLFQYISFHLTGNAPDLLIFSSQNSRIYNFNTAVGARFSGLSVEPYQYTLTVCFLSIALISQKYDFKKRVFSNLNLKDIILFLLASVTSLLSGSFFAYLNLVICLIIFFPFILKIIWSSKIKLLPFSIILGILSLSTIFFTIKSEVILVRIAAEALDSSAIEIVDNNPKNSLNRSFYDRTSRLFSKECRNFVFDKTIIIGDGLDTTNYHANCGMNMISFLIINFGILGNVLLYFLFIKRLNRTVQYWLFLTSFFFYPIVGSIFFPFVLGCITSRNKNTYEPRTKTLPS